MVFPLFGAFLSCAKYHNPNLIGKESSMKIYIWWQKVRVFKEQLFNFVEGICHNIACATRQN